MILPFVGDICIFRAISVFGEPTVGVCLFVFVWSSYSESDCMGLWHDWCGINE